ncbi:tannase/feruloyl esterase family alpha/beta hydrolase [Aquabacterium sp.]|uniref:tannase/feruloyl esterase family alpha/beta hydrolase n=1 Tax=Aquabacterium sp. TaxID=1872578 RepID=UPI002B8FB8B6|nr:tannase/feruloyl esterase family alpha/beta hydrolase [Aquabacterium sp.]HSW05155.1 tannase/feruloyl esterase family alpha/beta hydrolase [Aquabacterium sp.]
MALLPSLLAGAAAAALLAGCFGGDDDKASATDTFTTPLAVANAQAQCAALASKTIAASSIAEPTSGAVVTAATFKPAVADAPNAAGTAIVQGTPDYCQVLVDIKPVDAAAPVIKAQVNLPASWNGKSVQLGGGGLNGVLVTGLDPVRSAGPDTPLALTRSYMTLGTDSGHQNAAGVNTAAFSANNEALTNYAYAAYKKTRDVGIELSLAYYGHRPMKAYYIGGSEGGREGMIMAQRYPADFDGIVVVDPVIRLIGLWQYQLSMGQIQGTPGSWLGGKIQLIHDTVEAACDSLDGIADKVVSNTKACRPLADAAIVAKRCASGTDEGATCFSDGQINALRWIYTGQLYPFNLANGINSYPGYLYGSEGVPAALDAWVVGTTAPTTNPDAAGVSRSYTIGGQLVRYFVTKDLSFNPLTFNAVAHQPRLQELSKLMDMTNPDLSAFHARGGKLILRENLSDKGNSPQTGFDYYDAVVAKLGKDKVDQFFVAYGATGLPHTSPGLAGGTANAPSYGTPGRNDFVGLIDDWVVNGVKPAESVTLTNRTALPPYDIVASKPMCRYGYYPKYVGSTPAGGNVASNYVCTAA